MIGENGKKKAAPYASFLGRGRKLQRLQIGQWRQRNRKHLTLTAGDPHIGNSKGGGITAFRRLARRKLGIVFRVLPLMTNQLLGLDLALLAWSSPPRGFLLRGDSAWCTRHLCIYSGCGFRSLHRHGWRALFSPACGSSFCLVVRFHRLWAGGRASLKKRCQSRCRPIRGVPLFKQD